jgi:hypothetical protein
MVMDTGESLRMRSCSVFSLSPNTYLDLASRGGQKARLVGADYEVPHHVVEEETTSGAFARHMRVAAAQLGLKFANVLFKEGRNIS